jgi:hypothetical protein
MDKYKTQNWGGKKVIVVCLNYKLLAPVARYKKKWINETLDPVVNLN